MIKRYQINYRLDNEPSSLATVKAQLDAGAAEDGMVIDPSTVRRGETRDGIVTYYAIGHPAGPAPTSTAQRRALPPPNPLLAATLDDMPPAPLVPTPAGDDQREAFDAEAFAAWEVWRRAHPAYEGVSTYPPFRAGYRAARPPAPTVTTEQAWDEGYRTACADHSAWCRRTDGDHGQRHINPYRAALGIKIAPHPTERLDP